MSSSRPPYEASVTTASGTDHIHPQERPFQCARKESCRGAPQTKGLHPAGTASYEMSVRRPNAPNGPKKTIYICGTCDEHYRGKKTTTYRDKRADDVRRIVNGEGLHPEAHERQSGRLPRGDAEIHALTAAAQRHDTRVPVRAMGSVNASSPRQRISGGGPQVAYSSGGYTANHGSYDAARAQNRDRALGVARSGLKGAILVRIVYMPVRGKTLQTFETCQTTVGDVPVNVGSRELFQLALNAIMPEYRAALANLRLAPGAYFPLSDADVCMVNDMAVPFNMNVESGIIRASYFKNGGKEGASALVFDPKAKPVVVQLKVSTTWHSRFRQWRDEKEQEEIAAREMDVTVTKGKRKSCGDVSKLAKRAKQTPSIFYADITSMASPSAFDGPPSAGGMSFASGAALSVPSSASPSRSQRGTVASMDLALALSRATKTSTEDAQAFVQTRTFTVAFFMVKCMTLEELIPLMSLPRIKLFDQLPNRELTVDLSKTCVGGFKTAFFGSLHPTPFRSPTSHICAKQAHDLDHLTKQTTIMPTRNQLLLLPDELLTLTWSRTLMEMVYIRIGDVKQQRLAIEPTWKPALTVPDVCFTGAGLAVEQGDKGRAAVFMVEERIWGTFSKYIHNGSARLSPSLRDDPIALFLSFTQHAQYELSDRRAFVSDYQGGKASGTSDTIMLTDPQVITDPQLGDIFAGGNVQAAYHNFRDDHKCNSFCVDFGFAPFK
ncbi:Alpha-type protein kinase domain-containing protein [Mycena kentingensis (nom. inval.)]|nr:Alpha-type protein kinase domain-containing protein [Mycena kentingensis (nom. inval.)]